MTRLRTWLRVFLTGWDAELAEAARLRGSQPEDNKQGIRHG